MEILQEQFDALLKKGALEPLTHRFLQQDLCYAKKVWRACPIFDLKALNEFLKPKHFKMKSPESCRTTLLPGTWIYSINQKDAYFHIPIHPKSRRFLLVSFKGENYQFRALPFSLSSAPWLFTMVDREFA